MGKKKTSLYAAIKEGLEEMVAVEKGQKKPARVHKSEILDKIRRGREKAYNGDRTKPPAQRAEGAGER